MREYRAGIRMFARCALAAVAVAVVPAAQATSWHKVVYTFPTSNALTLTARPDRDGVIYGVDLPPVHEVPRAGHLEGGVRQSGGATEGD